MRKYVIMGIQGSGKGTHAKMLAEGFDLEHIAVGDIFRWNVQHHTKLGAQIRRTMAAGLLVGDDLVEGVVGVRLKEHDWNYGFIIDGFPRNERQAEFFLESYDIDGVIDLDLPDSEVARRVLARRLCANCGMDYNLIDNSPSTEGRCDACGGELIRREDDTEEALAVRLREYHAKTNPVLEIFRRKEYVITMDSRPGKPPAASIASGCRPRLAAGERHPGAPVHGTGSDGSIAVPAAVAAGSDDRLRHGYQRLPGLLKRRGIWPVRPPVSAPAQGSARGDPYWLGPGGGRVVMTAPGTAGRTAR